MKKFWVACGLLLVGKLAYCQSYVISTVAGGGLPPSPSVASAVSIYPSQVAFDAAGNLYFTSENVVFRVDQQGNLTRVAGSVGAGFSGDGGPATSAQLNKPRGVAVDSAGNLFIADSGNALIRKVSPGGIITTAAGNGTPNYTGDGGPATSASLAAPYGVAVDGSGNLFIADNSRIRKVSSGGTITTVAGNGTWGYSGDGGPAISAELAYPTGVAVDGPGNVYIADYVDNCVRKVTPSGIITTVVGNGLAGFSGDGGPAASAQLNVPYSVAVDNAGVLFIADAGNYRVRKVMANGIITTYAGAGPATQGYLGPTGGYSGDGGPATSALLNAPDGVAIDSAGNLAVADAGNFRVRRVASNGIITTVAGNGTFGYSGDGGPATSAQLYQAANVAVDSGDNLFISGDFVYSANSARVRKVSTNGIITTVAGGGTQLTEGGLATNAALSSLGGVTVDAVGDIFFGDGNTVQKVMPNGNLATVAGGGHSSIAGFTGDGGLATSAVLGSVNGLALDGAGNLFIADGQPDFRVRKVAPNGIITTVAGNGTFGYSGDGGPATSAQLSGPQGLAVDNTGNLYIADFYDDFFDYQTRIRKVAPNGIITTVAGGGTPTVVGDALATGDGGPAISAFLVGGALGVAVDGAGNLLIADGGANRIRKVDAHGIITTVAGTGVEGLSGDGGLAADAQLNNPSGLAVDGAGNIFIADSGNTVIRRLQPIVPAVLPNGVKEAAGFSAVVAAGGIGSIFGSNLASSAASAATVPLPLSLSGTSVALNGIPAPLFYVSNGQINFQVPWELQAAKTASLVVTNGGVSSPSITISLSPAAPGIFIISGTQGAAVSGSGTLAAAVGSIVGITSQPAAAGEVISVYCSGLGAVSGNTPADGASGDAQPTAAAVTATIGGVSAAVGFAGLAPGFAGLYQVNVQIPAGLGINNAVPIIVSTLGLSSNTATIAVQ